MGFALAPQLLYMDETRSADEFPQFASYGSWRSAPLAQLTEAIEYALDIDVSDADSTRMILDHRADQPVELSPLEGRLHLAHLRVDAQRAQERCCLWFAVAELGNHLAIRRGLIFLT
jgi:hypothetical protein